MNSFPAVGRVTAAELISEIGEDRGRYPMVQALLAEAGAAPVTLASGKIRSDPTTSPAHRPVHSPRCRVPNRVPNFPVLPVWLGLT